MFDHIFLKVGHVVLQIYPFTKVAMILIFEWCIFVLISNFKYSAFN